MEKSKSYHQYLIESLQDPTESALYLWAILQEENPENELLPLALNHVLEALGQTIFTEEEMKNHQIKLQLIMQQKGVKVIYDLVEWLKPLGLELGFQSQDLGENLLSQKITNVENLTLIKT